MKSLVNILSTFAILAISGLAKADVSAVHGMLLFGQETTYASHLPMFHHPHDYQLIMELKLYDVPRSETLKGYELLKVKGETLFTLVPEKMDLSQVISGEKTSFQAEIYHGHFERGGKNLGPVNVSVEWILYSKKLNGSQTPGKTNEYFVFGENGEYFAAHVIKSKPSFDSILSVTQPYILCRTRVCTGTTMVGNDKLPLVLTDNSRFGLQLPEEKAPLGYFTMVDVEKVIYLEGGELKH